MWGAPAPSPGNLRACSSEDSPRLREVVITEAAGTVGVWLEERADSATDPAEPGLTDLRAKGSLVQTESPRSSFTYLIDW